MIPNVYSISDALTLRVCRTEKFKAGMLSVSAVLPIERDKTWLTSLLLSVIKRGTERYPTLEALNRRLDYLYGTDIAIRNFYRGDCQVIGFSAEFLEGAYLPEGETLIPELLEIVAQMLFCPLTDENGLLLARYVESEKQVQCDAIRALKNNPRSYASEHFREVFYENEPCGASLYGTEEEVMAVTPQQLTAHWQDLLSTLSLDCFYVGATEPALVCDALSQTVGKALSKEAVRIDTPIPCKVVRTAERVRRVEEQLEVGQGHLLIGFRTGCSIRDLYSGEPYLRFICRVVFPPNNAASPLERILANPASSTPRS